MKKTKAGRGFWSWLMGSRLVRAEATAKTRSPVRLRTTKSKSYERSPQGGRFCFLALPSVSVGRTGGESRFAALVGPMLRQAQALLPIRADRPGLHELPMKWRISSPSSGIRDGLLTLFCRHTSASLDHRRKMRRRAARRDLEAYFEPDRARGRSRTSDDEEGARTTCPRTCAWRLTQTQLSIPLPGSAG